MAAPRIDTYQSCTGTNSPATGECDPEYHLSSDLVDNAIGYLTDHVGYRAEDPFFLQLAFGATHAPLQVPGEWVDRYRGRYDDGWDRTRARRHARQQELGVTPPGTQLTGRDDTVPVWDDLTADQRALAARAQEAYAGFLEHTDAQIGRLVEWLEHAGQMENTIIAVFSDNGAAGDGRELGTTNVIGPYNNLQTPQASEHAGLDAADIELIIDGQGAGSGHLPTTSMQLAFYGLDIGRDRSARTLANGRPGRNFPTRALEEITVLFDSAAEHLTHLSHNLEANE
ncbi:sulfatase-like hydrolase/transferase [Microbacterium sp. ZW CA_36]|uniref:sulfatase-like hydrolase/transferase n=1 Tax=Microbacterium sp. ZW CA_36 TaxID=3378078 RepID=UPI003851B67E